MISLLSPAKNLDFSPISRAEITSIPSFLYDSEYLISKLKKLSPRQIGKIMSINPELAALNYQRFNDWNIDYKDVDKKAALFAFNGEVYRSLDATTLTEKQVQFANHHLIILSGLYGMLKPLDLIQPYRLEMGLRLNITAKQKSLYKYWSEKITASINELMKNQKQKVLVNLASNEYSSVIDEKKLNCDFLTCQFLDWKNESYKSVMTWAKKARGSMARQIILNNVDTAQEIKDLSFDGYNFNKSMSTELNYVFTRK